MTRLYRRVVPDAAGVRHGVAIGGGAVARGHGRVVRDRRGVEELVGVVLGLEELLDEDVRDAEESDVTHDEGFHQKSLDKSESQDEFASQEEPQDERHHDAGDVVRSCER